MTDGTMYDLIIAGGGPAGAAAAVYAARKRLKTAFVTAEWGGQSVVSTEIQNWIGTPKISGADLAASLKKHVEEYKGDILDIISPASVRALRVSEDHVEIETDHGSLSGRALLVATGAKRRTLDIPGAKEYEMKGLTYCASCDGLLFEGKDVAVVGGGNAAFETALQLLAYCKSVTLLNRTEAIRADEITVAAAAAHPNMRIIKNAVPARIIGEQFATGIAYTDAQTGAETTLPAEGIFVEIGLVPNTDWLGEAVKKTPAGQIITDPRTGKTSHPRVWAAGDCTDALYHQNNIAVGEAVTALEDIYVSLRRA